MFTGIVEEIGEVVSIEKASNLFKIKIKASKVLEDVKKGDSIAVDGACLTVTDFTSTYFTADIIFETKKTTKLNLLRPKTKVNLERALAVGMRFGGHLVSGHIDGVGQIINIQKIAGKYNIKIKLDSTLMKFIIKKGSICIDGISLTVSDVLSNVFIVSLIPHTLKETTLHLKKVGNTVNVETDLVGKYILKSSMS